MSFLFNVIGLRHPGRVNLFHFGTVDLCSADDTLLLKIYKADPKIRFLKPTPEGLKVLYPNSVLEVKPRIIDKPVVATESPKQNDSITSKPKKKKPAQKKK
jgi:hypothetical protein